MSENVWFKCQHQESCFDFDNITVINILIKNDFNYFDII